MLNKKSSFILLALLIVFLTGLTAATAADTNDSQAISESVNVASADVISQVDVTTQTNDVVTTTANKPTQKKAIKNEKVVKKDDTTTNTTTNINKDNYNTYFDSTGTTLDTIKENTTIILSGDFEDKNFQITTPNLYITGDDTTNIKNGQIRIDVAASGVTLTNIKINNTNITSFDSSIENSAENVTISNNNVFMEKVSGFTYAIRNYGANTKITQNNVTLNGPCTDIDFSGEGLANTIAIVTLYCENVSIANNNVSVNQANGTTPTSYGTIECIDMKGKNITVNNNTLSIKAKKFVYAVNALGAEDVKITNNKIHAESERYTAGVQYGTDYSGLYESKGLYLANNNIKCISKKASASDDEAIAYGAIASSNPGYSCENVTLENNTINLNANVGYGIEVYTVTGSKVNKNNINVNGSRAMGIVYAHSINNMVDSNIINTTGDNSTKIGSVVEEITPVNVGIQLQQGSHFTNITNNQIYTEDKKDQAKTINVASVNDVIIKNNILDTDKEHGQATISAKGTDITLENNTRYTIIITKENYSLYFDDDGVITGLEENDAITLSGEFTDKNFIITLPGINVFGDNTTIIRNGRILITEDAMNVVISGIKINNTNTTIEASIENQADNTVVANNTVYMTKKTGTTNGIKNTASNVVISDNNVTVYGPSENIGWDSGSSLTNTIAIATLDGYNVTVTNNIAKALQNPNTEAEAYGTIDGIEVKGTEVRVNNNTIVVEGKYTSFVYAINGLGMADVNITNNRIEAYSERYIAGIQVGSDFTSGIDGANVLIANNTIIGNSKNLTDLPDNEAMAYGIISSTMGGSACENITIINNNIAMNATVGYGLELYTTNKVKVINNTITMRAPYAMGMGFAHATENIIDSNNITTYGDSSVGIQGVVEEIQPANVGIQIQQESDDTNITNNRVITFDAASGALAINVEDSNNLVVKNNIIDTNTDHGTKAMSIPKGQSVENNTGYITTVTKDNYSQYFNAKGEMINIPECSQVILSGEFTDKNFTVTVPGTLITCDENGIIRNGKVRIDSNATSATISHININNTNTTIDASIENAATNAIIVNNTIYMQQATGITQGIKNYAGYTLIRANNVTVYGPCVGIDWNGEAIANTIGIVTLYGDNVRILNNNIKVFQTNGTTAEAYGTTDGIDVRGNRVSVLNNNIEVNAQVYTYGINVMGEKLKIQNNTINMKSERYVAGIQAGSDYSGIYNCKNVNITNNKITGIANKTSKNASDAVAYGIISSSMGGSMCEKIKIDNNTVDLKSNVGYGMEIYTCINTNITKNNIKVDAIYATGIGVSKSINNNIKLNNITTHGNSLKTIGAVSEDIEPANAGINLDSGSHYTNITNNKIYSDDTNNTAKTVNVKANNNDILIANNIVDTNTLNGQDSIALATGVDVKSENNTRNIIIITQDNYSQYFDANGKMLDTIQANLAITLSGEFTNKTFKVTKANLLITGDNTAQIINGQILINSKNTTLKNIKINDTDATFNYAIQNNGENTLIDNNTVYISKTTGIVNGIQNNADNVTIANNNVTVEGPSNNIPWSYDVSYADTIAIITADSEDVLIENNTVTALHNNKTTPASTGTIYAIEAYGMTVTINNNTVVVYSPKYVYAINTVGCEDVYVTNNNIKATSERYIAGIQLGDAPDAEVLNNTINGVCANTTALTNEEAIGYGVIVQSIMGMCDNTIINNNIININSTIAYGVEVFSSRYSNITNNNITLNGAYSIGVGLALSRPVNITANNIKICGDSSQKINPITENVQPAISGVVTTQGACNATILNNNIHVIDLNGNATGVLIGNVTLKNSIDATVKNNIIDTNTLHGNDAVLNTTTSNMIVENNTGLITTITEDNYSQYFNENGEMINIPQYTQVILSGEFTNKTFTITTPYITISGDNTTIYNGKVTINNAAMGVILSGIKINNTNTTIEVSLENNADNTVIANNTVYMEKVSGTTNGIKNKASNVVISGNNVVVYGPCAGIDWAGDGIVKTIAIATLGGDNVTIANNTAKALQAPNSVVEMYGSIDAVELKGTNIRVENNNITAKAEGAGFVYALNGLGMADVNITNNTIEAYSERYIAGIQIGSDFISGIDGANVLIANNRIIGNSKNLTVLADNEAMAYGIISSTMGGNACKNTTIINNTIDMNATVGYGLELYGTQTTTVKNNTIIMRGIYSIGMGFAHAAGNIIDSNNITTYGDSSLKIQSVVEEIVPANVGIKLQQGSGNSNITNNQILTIDENKKATTINVVGSDDVIIKNNIVDTNVLNGEESISANGTGVKSENNTSYKSKTQTVVDLPSEAVTSTNITIKVNVIDINTNEKINSGYVVIKVNGKTIQVDGSSKIRFINGTAQVTYSLLGFTAKDYDVVVKYSGDNLNLKSENSTTFTVVKTNMTLESKTLTKYASEEIEVNETLRDVNGNVLSGRNKVAVKLNGKTIYNGEVIDGKLYFKVKLPADLRPGVSNLTIIIGESKTTNANSVNYTINVEKQDVIITIEPVASMPGRYTTFKATMRTAISNMTVNGGKFSVKINGKTITPMNTDKTPSNETPRVYNGEAVLKTFIPSDMSAKKYDITFTYAGDNYTNGCKCTLNDGLIVIAKVKA